MSTNPPVSGSAGYLAGGGRVLPDTFPFRKGATIHISYGGNAHRPAGITELIPNSDSVMVAIDTPGQPRTTMQFDHDAAGTLAPGTWHWPE